MYRYVLHMYVCMYDVFSHVPVNIFKDIFSRRNCPVLWFSEITCDDLVLIFTLNIFDPVRKTKCTGIEILNWCGLVNSV